MGGMIILTRIVKTYVVKMYARFVWMGTETRYGSLWSQIRTLELQRRQQISWLPVELVSFSIRLALLEQS
jgi:hypothetical protein